MDYLKQKQIIAKVDKVGNIIGEIEKWEAHKKGILHKALSVTLTYKGKYIIQHRKHPAFDGVYDLTSSSHQLIVGGILQSTLEATYSCLKREWNLEKKDLKKTIVHGSIYYKAKDPKSIYTEHEVCEMLTIEVKKMPMPNFEFAYGFSLLSKDEITNKDSRIYGLLAPWTKVAIEKGYF